MSLMILNYLWCRIEQVHLLSTLAFDANEFLAHAELVDVSSLPQFVFLQLLLKLCNIQVMFDLLRKYHHRNSIQARSTEAYIHQRQP